MKQANGKGFAAKHPDAPPPDPRIVTAVTVQIKDNHLACAKAHEIAQSLAVSPAQVGLVLDLLEFRISHCQLGLFGYGAPKKLVKGADTVAPHVQEAIAAAAVGGRLACAHAWEIADRLNIRRLALANACEALGIRIKPCQLGAF
jgi:hypothetical protein